MLTEWKHTLHNRLEARLQSCRGLPAQGSCSESIRPAPPCGLLTGYDAHPRIIAGDTGDGSRLRLQTNFDHLADEALKRAKSTTQAAAQPPTLLEQGIGAIRPQLEEAVKSLLTNVLRKF